MRSSLLNNNEEQCQYTVGVKVISTIGGNECHLTNNKGNINSFMNSDKTSYKVETFK